MKNIKSKARITTNNEGYSLGSGKAAWAVEVDGEIDLQKIRSTRALARNARDNLAETYGRTISLSVRKVLIVPIAGR